MGQSVDVRQVPPQPQPQTDWEPLIDVVLELQPEQANMNPTLLLLAALGVGPPGEEDEDALSFGIIRPALLQWVGSLTDSQLRRALPVVLRLERGKVYPLPLLEEGRRLMRHFEEEGSATPPTVDVFLENWVEHSDAGIVESILSLLSQRTRKGVLQATANNLRERRLQYKQWENEATKERKKKRQLQLWQAFQNGREKHPTGSLPAEYPPDNRNTLQEREALLHLQQQWDRVTPEARERMLQHIVAQIPPHMLQELAIHIATAHSLLGDNSPPTSLTTIRLHLRRPNEEEEDRDGSSRQRAPAATAAATTEGDKRRNEQEARGKEERAKENLAHRYETMGKRGQQAVQFTQIDIAGEEESKQPTQLVGEATQRRYEAAKKKGKEEVQREQEVERMLEEERQTLEEARRGEDRLTREEQDQIAQHIQEEEEQEDTDLQHFYYNHMEDVLDEDTGRPGWQLQEDGRRVCEAWQEEKEKREEEEGGPGKPDKGKDKEETRKEDKEQKVYNKEGKESEESAWQRRHEGGCDNDPGAPH